MSGCQIKTLLRLVLDVTTNTKVSVSNDIQTQRTGSRLPWVPEVFLACGGTCRPETALEKSLAPRVDRGKINFKFRLSRFLVLLSNSTK